MSTPLDLTTFTKTDPNGYLTVTAAEMLFVNVPSGPFDVDLSYDFGVDFFFRNFTIEGQVKFTPALSAFILSPAVGNENNNVHYGSNSLGVALYGPAGGQAWIGLGYSSTLLGTVLDTFVVGDVYNTDVYYTMIRDETVGANGTLYLYAYSDAAKTVLIGDTSITLPAKDDYRYINVIKQYHPAVTATESGSNKNLSYTADTFIPPTAKRVPSGQYPKLTMDFEGKQGLVIADLTGGPDKNTIAEVRRLVYWE